MKQVLFVLLILTAISCKNLHPTLVVTADQSRAVDSTAGTSPFLTHDHNGNIVLSWVRTLEDSSSVFCYAVSNDGGKTFNKPVVIPASINIHAHSENIPKVIFKPSGEIVAVWGVSNPNAHNKYSGLVNYSQSIDGGKTWTDATPLVTDTASFDQRYSDVALLANGEIGIGLCIKADCFDRRFLTAP